MPELTRCDDLQPFFDGELSDEQAAAFRIHLGMCEPCQQALQGLMQEAAIVHGRRRSVSGWPLFASPGWLAAYAIALLAWLAIDELWGGVVVVALIAGGLFGTLGVVHWLGETNRPHPPAMPEDR